MSMSDRGPELGQSWAFIIQSCPPNAGTSYERVPELIFAYPEFGQLWTQVGLGVEAGLGGITSLS